jgi:hypothetical protein
MMRIVAYGLITLALSTFSWTKAGTAYSQEKPSDTSDLTVAQMTGPMTDATNLFGRLYVSNDYQGQSANPLDEQRFQFSNDGTFSPWQSDLYTWENPTFSHNPLYFEQVNLERYGWKSPRCFHPAMSAVHFFGSVGAAPIKLLHQPPHRCISTAGHLRPGACMTPHR